MIRTWRQFPSELLCSYSLLVMHLMDLHTSNIVAHTRVRVTVAGRSSGANRSRDTRPTRGSWTSRSPRGALAARSALPLWTWEETQEETIRRPKKRPEKRSSVEVWFYYRGVLEVLWGLGLQHLEILSRPFLLVDLGTRTKHTCTCTHACTHTDTHTHTHTAVLQCKVFFLLHVREKKFFMLPKKE